MSALPCSAKSVRVSFCRGAVVRGAFEALQRATLYSGSSYDYPTITVSLPTGLPVAAIEVPPSKMH